ncbi:hypothetical protein GEV38_12835 [Pseudomonas sp. 13159349]|nr:hypothetical protein GEV38_12835 [Pseudomonas sp. 13159349]
MGAGLPAKQAPRWMAPAVPVFAGKPAPTMIAVGQNDSYGSLSAERTRTVIQTGSRSPLAGPRAVLTIAPYQALGCLSPTTDRQLHRPPSPPPGQPGDPRPRW